MIPCACDPWLAALLAGLDDPAEPAAPAPDDDLAWTESVAAALAILAPILVAIARLPA